MLIYEEKINLNNKIKNVKNKKKYKEIYFLLKDELDDIMIHNNNGIFFNLNYLSQNKLIKLNNFLNNLDLTDSECISIKYNTYSSESNNHDLKFSNKEKTIIKKITNN